MFAAAYACSGAAALVYEVTWTRQLTLLMGQSTAAASTVLAAMMGGLAAGAALAGRIEQRTEAPAGRSRLGTFAALELATAAAALALPFALAATAPLLTWAYGDAETPLRFALVRGAIALVLVGLPAAAMGATFPIAVGWFAPTASAAGVLYAVNTGGAAAGALAAGFWLLPAFGIRGTTWVAVALNAVAAAVALRLAAGPLATAGPDPAAAAAGRAPGVQDAGRAASRRRGRTAPAAAAPRSSPPPVVVPGWIAVAAAGVSGAVALAYEVVWTRLAALVMGPTTYAFAGVVAAFILGIALGAAVGARLAQRSANPVAWLGACFFGGAVAASLAASVAASRLPLVVAAQVAASTASFAPVLLQQVAGAIVLLLPLTMALGAAFPLALAAVGPARAVGATAARVYAANTCGAIAGALAGGFVLLPLAGLETGLRLTAGIGVIAALVLWSVAARAATATPARAWWRVAAAVIVGAAAVLLPPWDMPLLAAGGYKYAPYFGVDDLATELRAWRILSYEDGGTASVGVRELAGVRSVVIDGKVDASNAGDMLTQRLLGLLPVLVHGSAQDVLVIGLGSGVTAAATMATGTVTRADVVEISPEVVRASAFFTTENGDVLRRPGVRLMVGDGRSHLAFARRQYDVIVSEPSNPWMAGIAALFTREFFESAAARLKPGGVICQWAHTYDMRPEDLQSIVRTFGSVFPQATLWLVGDGDLLLIGTSGPSIESRLEALTDGWRRGDVPAQLQRVGVDVRHLPFLLWSQLAGGPAELRAFGGDGPLERDDRLALEFSAPRAIYGRSTVDNAATIRGLWASAPTLASARAAWSAADAAAWTAAGAMALKADAFDAAVERYLRAVALDPAQREALQGLWQAATAANRRDVARGWLERTAAADPGNVAVRIALSRALASEGNLEGAATAAAEAANRAPGDPEAGEQLAAVFADARDAARLGALAERLVAQFPDRPRPRLFRAQALLLAGRVPDAVREARHIVAARPADVRAQNLLGIACATGGDRQCARAAFDAALGADPRDVESWVNLGVLLMDGGDPASALERFSAAVTLDRGSAAARQGLAEATAALATRR